MRPGSKKYRVYMVTKEQIERNGPMHMDNMIETVAKGGVFVGVKDRRAYYANLLSQYARKDLLISDGRGTYDLPHRRAAQ